MSDTSAGLDAQGLPLHPRAFLKACQIEPDAGWHQQRQWHVLQTGFDLGLRFLAIGWAWQQSPVRPERLFFTVVTDQPLPSQETLKTLRLPPELRALHAEMVAAWRGMMPGTHRLVLAHARLQLTVHAGPGDKLLRELDVAADQVLAGEPALTPAWAQAHGHPRYSATRSQLHLRGQKPPALREALVLGAGLSGAATAHSLAIRGWAVTVLDQGEGPGAGASGLPAGLAAPHVSPDDSVLSRISRAGVRATLQRAQALLVNQTDWAQSGVLEHRVEGKRSLPQGPAWPHSAHEWSTQALPAQIRASGLPAQSHGLWHGMAGWVRPRALVAAQLQTPGVDVRWQQSVQGLERQGELWVATDGEGRVVGQAPVLVVACAFDSLALLQPLPGFVVPLNPLRGQISWGHMAELSHAQRQLLPPFPVNGHGSFISGVSAPDGPAGWFIGSTFERNCTQAPVRSEDHAANGLRLATLLPALGEAMKPQFEPERASGWAGLRCTLPDRLPAVGPIEPERLPGLWINAGMGARGISLAVLCGELTAAWLENEPLPLAPSLAKHLAAQRFASR